MDQFLTVAVSLTAVFAAAGLAWRAGRASVAVTEEPSSPAPEPVIEAPEEKPEPVKAKGFHDLASDLDDAWSKSPTLDAFRQSEILKNAVEAAAAFPEADLQGYARRGLRQRPWALDFDSSATEFLLEQGFSPTLGARPLQRAIDRHLLGPLAEAIVRGEFGDGEDLVFLYEKDGRLRWDLASATGAAEMKAAPAEEELPALSLRRLVLGPTGSREEIQSLEARLTDLAGLIELDAFHERRASIFTAMAADGFWTSASRFAVLGEAEYIDRIESAVTAARKTLHRLSSNPPSPVPLRALISKMALRVHLLERAWPDVAEGKPSAAWIGLRPADDSPKSAALATALAGMIEQWAEARGMHVEALKIPGWSRAWAIEGFAALRILEDEGGIHIGEEGGLGETARVEIATAPQASEPTSMLTATFTTEALEAARSSEIVRRYQDRPTPLVRDRRKGFRTGRLDLVLAGHFDLMDA